MWRRARLPLFVLLALGLGVATVLFVDDSPVTAERPAVAAVATSPRAVEADALPQSPELSSDPLPADANDTPEDEEDEVPLGTGELVVRVVEGSAASAGVRVAIGSYLREPETEEPPRTFTTDSRGEVRATLPAEEHEVWIDVEGYSEAPRSVLVEEDETTTMELQLVRAIEVRFELRDASGSALPEAAVMITHYVLTDSGRIDDARSIDFGVDAADGRRVRLPPGEYTFRGVCEGYSAKSVERRLAPGPPERVSFELVPVASALELLVLCEGAPCAGARAEVHEEQAGDETFSARTDSSGRATLKVPSTALQLRVTKGEYERESWAGALDLRLREGETRELTLRLEPTGGVETLRGVVVDPAGRPWPKAGLSVACGSHRRSVQTASDGSFVLDGLPRRECEVSLRYVRSRHANGAHVEHLQSVRVEPPGELRLTHRYAAPEAK